MDVFGHLEGWLAEKDDISQFREEIESHGRVCREKSATDP